jgi:hypothetical protein
VSAGKEFRAWWKCSRCDAAGNVPVPRELWPPESEPSSLIHSTFALPAVLAHDEVCPARVKVTT